MVEYYVAKRSCQNQLQQTNVYITFPCQIFAQKINRLFVLLLWPNLFGNIK